MVQCISTVDVLEVGLQSFVEQHALHLFNCQSILLPDELDEGYLVEGVDIIYSTTKVSQQSDETQLSPQSCIQQRS